MYYALHYSQLNLKKEFNPGYKILNTEEEFKSIALDNPRPDLANLQKKGLLNNSEYDLIIPYLIPIK
ncbi:hypothetical protein BpHYR1_022671 [Brachionus plicatilis]|uniref:Uncharacterized protein n=1 Tax=Brachionus plicatilis TaxID=10195 RepID=A0A3M7SJ93_BRAPC|nr:hypothetical protein BpHYR1_022671 [Brachionus plicatilis]